MKMLAPVIFALATAAAAAQDAPPLTPAAPSPEAPRTVAYYYKVRWGFQDEFERLFLKNHYPILAEQMKSGRLLGVNLYRPTFHGDGRADWTFLVVIRFAGWTALGGPSPEEAIARRLFPDQDTFKKEERRRFEILDAHWDVPLTPVEPPPS
jgi:hypothetical protein